MTESFCTVGGESQTEATDLCELVSCKPQCSGFHRAPCSPVHRSRNVQESHQLCGQQHQDHQMMTSCHCFYTSTSLIVMVVLPKALHGILMPCIHQLATSMKVKTKIKMLRLSHNENGVLLKICTAAHNGMKPLSSQLQPTPILFISFSLQQRAARSGWTLQKASNTVQSAFYWTEEFPICCSRVLGLFPPETTTRKSTFEQHRWKVF